MELVKTFYAGWKVCVQLNSDRSINGMIFDADERGIFISSISGKQVFASWNSVVMIEPLEKMVEVL
jgi:hypothetical protein